MLLFPNAKINIGLFVTEKRSDGYHNIESIFTPIPLKDALEIIPNADETSLAVKGINLEGPITKNLVYKAWELLHEDYQIPHSKLILLKNIPFGAGLGGGSADASFCLNALNEIYNLNLRIEQLEAYAAKIGADCPFFIQNKAAYIHGIGDKMDSINLNLKGYHILLTKPNFEIPTPMAYKNIKPEASSFNLLEIGSVPIDQWHNHINNDFEKALFPIYPQLNQLKELHYTNGAVYAQMSGSGSAVYGIYKTEPELTPFSKLDVFTFKGQL